MSIQRIVTRKDVPAYSQRVELDGEIFVLSFRYNLRAKRWFFDIQNEQGVDVLLGLPLQTGVGLTSRYVIEELPAGEFVIVNREDDNRNPEREDLGESHQLLYNEADA